MVANDRTHEWVDANMADLLPDPPEAATRAMLLDAAIPEGCTTLETVRQEVPHDALDWSGPAGKHLRGATMGLHSMAGHPGGFPRPPLGVGSVLDLDGGDGVLGWWLAVGRPAVVLAAFGIVGI